MRHLSCLLILLLTSSLASAQLTWEKKEASITAKASDVAAVVEYRFVNKGAKAVSIREIRATCDCSTADADKRVIQPGERGKITAHFEFGTRVGSEKKTFRVITDDPASDAELVMQVEIPESIRVTPQFIYWTPQETGKEKFVEFLVVGDIASVNITELRSNNGVLKTSLKTVKEGKHYLVALNVPEGSGPTEAMVTIQTDYPKDKPRAYQVFARVTASRRNRSAAPSTNGDAAPAQAPAPKNP